MPNLTDEMQEVVDWLRGRGWAVHMVSPDDLDGEDPGVVEAKMRTAVEYLDGQSNYAWERVKT